MPLPSQVPSFPQVAAVASVQAFSGSAPFGTLVQVPSAPASAQDAHPPVQLEAQQYPCWQKPEAHCAVPEHAVPSGCSEQVPPLQTLGAVQSALVVQLVLQTLFVVSQAKAWHEEAVGGVQVPVPLQSAGGENIEPVQLPGAHCVPAAYFWHAPAPSQKPLLPQVGAPASLHCASGSWPDGTLTQAPRLPVSPQDWQVPVHAELQQ